MKDIVIISILSYLLGLLTAIVFVLFEINVDSGWEIPEIAVAGVVIGYLIRKYTEK
ncbi:MAG: hypothetical protein V1779_00115 [bacterium]